MIEVGKVRKDWKSERREDKKFKNPPSLMVGFLVQGFNSEKAEGFALSEGFGFLKISTCIEIAKLCLVSCFTNKLSLFKTQ